MDDPKPIHIYDVPLDILPDIFQYLELGELLAYGSASQFANEQVRLGKSRKYKIHIACTSNDMCIVLREKPENESEEDRWPVHNNTNCKIITIRIRESNNESIEDEQFLVMDSNVVPVIHSGIDSVATFWENKHKGLEFTLRHLKHTFNVSSVSAHFHLISNDEIFPILEIIRARGLAIENFSRSLSNYDPDLVENVEQLREVPASTVIVTSDTRFYGRLQYPELRNAKYYYAKHSKVTVDTMGWMLPCWYIILGSSSWTNADFNLMLQIWMENSHKLQLFCLSNPKDLDVSLIIDGLNAAPVDPKTAANIDKGILPGQCFRCRRSNDGAGFLIYQSQTEFVVKRELALMVIRAAPLYEKFSMLSL
ncbi:hypothetical protein CAEBREN_08599 [Caenorhabditis brenneri]|uniref:F-box domain-containing protein n=1 Tax=Caenorhabditis brenneri TaxID=135651 RepID=G0MQG6_CAEBE|nr:hypothetical protein CAEBREN_08599 [Caenorhabditis brenneri]